MCRSQVEEKSGSRHSQLTRREYVDVEGLVHLFVSVFV